jgi:uncharacterized protein (DUF488 family)
VTIYTIGFTKHSAEEFFGILQRNQVKRVIDIRINKTSQLGGFAKVPDLPYFLQAVGGIEYQAIESLAPSKELLSQYRDKSIQWDEFQSRYLSLLESREVLDSLNPTEFDSSCLLCSENTPEKCHRRLLGEVLASRWGVEIVHL